MKFQEARIQQIRRRIIDRAYSLSAQAEDEMIDDRLERADIENAMLKGKIQKKLYRRLDEINRYLSAKHDVKERLDVEVAGR